MTAGRSQALVNTWFKYTVNNSDVYTLTAIQTDLSNDADTAQNNDTTTTIIDDRNISLLTKNNNRVYGNEDTVYLVAGMDTVTVGNDTYGVIADADEVIVGVDNVSIEVTTTKAAVDKDLKPTGAADSWSTKAASYGLSLIHI